MIDVKKLITGFLILATAAVSSGVILSLISNNPVVAKTPTGPTITGNTASGTEAFLPNEPLQNAFTPAEVASSTMLQSSTNPNNLTDVMATEFVNAVATANPNGPTGVDANGNPIISSPDVNSIASLVANATTTQNLQIPNWDIEAASIPVTTMIASGSAPIAQYGAAVKDILNNHINTQVQNILNSGATGATASDLAYVGSQIQGALQDIAALKTPAATLGFQKGLIKVLVYEKNMLQLMNVAQTDPVRASLVFQGESTKFDAAQQNLVNQAQALVNKNVSLEQGAQNPQNTMLSFMDNVFGIPEAHAQIVVSDPALFSLITANQAEIVAKQIEAILKNTLLQILKNILIALIQNKVLAWVQGSGAPRFITDWGTTLINSAQQMALNRINADMTCGIYPAFAPQVAATLKVFYTPATDNFCANQFAAALGSYSFNDFYSNFQNGGFIAFGASMLPSGNPFGSQFFEAQKTDLAYNNQQAATALQTQTSGGFKGDQVCDDGSDPNGSTPFCESPSGQYGTLTGNTCPTGDKLVSIPNNGVCADGTQPVVTTPSAVTAFTLKSGIDATPKEIAAANDITGLLNSVLSSLMLSLANTAVNAAGQFVNQTLTSINPSGITGSGSAPAAAPLACSPTSQTIPAATSTSTYPTTFSASGGTPDANGNYPTYSWSDSNGVTGTGGVFSDVFANPGSYTVTLSDSANDTPATCDVIVQ